MPDAPSTRAERRRRSSASASERPRSDISPHGAAIDVRELVETALRHHRAGRLSEAEATYRRVLAVEPENIDALHFLGVIAHQQDDHERAAELISRALSLNDSNAPAHNNLGNALQALGRVEEAMASFHRALDLVPDYVDAYVNLGSAFRSRLQLAEAVRCYETALALAPEDPIAHSNLGNAFHDSDMIEQAIACHRRALEIDPDFALAHGNLANVLATAGHLQEAENHYRRALALDPGRSPTRFAYALFKLLQGNYEAGWPLFESRLERNVLTHGVYAGLAGRLAQLEGVPRWRGDHTQGKALLVWTDQGLGDTLMMMRYLHGVKNRGIERLTVRCEPALVRIMQTLPEVDEVISVETPLPAGEFDCHCPIMSLPLLFGTRLDTVPGEVPYLRVPAPLRDEWASRVSDVEPLRIGLVWTGRRDFPRAYLRSIGLDRLAPLFSIPGTSYVSLQKGETGVGEPRAKLIDFMRECSDLLDTAALMEQLDLVISVDTAPAHLAGALGKRVWLLNRFESEWRWMLGREDSPWYPTMRIFRQREPGNWGEVVTRVASALQALTSGGQERPTSDRAERSPQARRPG